VYNQTQGSRAVFFLLRITLDLNIFTVLLTLHPICKDVMNSLGVKITIFSMINMLEQVHLASQLILLHSSHALRNLFPCGLLSLTSIPMELPWFS
jgi:hypothetical protein